MARFRGLLRPFFDKNSAKKAASKESAKNLAATTSSSSDGSGLIEVDAASQEDLLQQASTASGSSASSESIPLVAGPDTGSSSSMTSNASAPSHVRSLSATQYALRLTYKQCRDLTNNFCEADEYYLGEGSFGKVYLGIWRIKKDTPSERRVAVAVKRLKHESHQGIKEWTVRHRRHECCLTLNTALLGASIAGCCSDFAWHCGTGMVLGPTT